MIPEGIYIVADDNALRWLVAFLNSVRYWNPNIAICIIPYSSNVRAVRRLAPIYGYSFFENNEVLRKCDAVSVAFHGEVRGFYRKFAAWEGLFEKFAYFDSDAVLTAPVGWLFPLLDKMDFLFGEGPAPGNTQYVWRKSISSTGKLNQEQIDFSASAGFFASRKSSLSLEMVQDVLPKALELKEHMDLGSSDQPLLNYIVVTSGKRFTSLKALANKKGNETVMSAIWSGIRGGIVWRGRIFILTSQRRVALFHPKVFYVHWAGETTKIYRGNSWWDDFAKGKSVAFDGKKVLGMRYRKLWEYYAYLKDGENRVFTVADIDTLLKCRN